MLSLFVTLMGLAWAACTSPAGDVGHLTYDGGVIKFCNGSTWTNTSGTTGASCSGTTAGTINYSSGDLRYCNGTNWISMKGASAGSCSGTTAGTYNYDTGSSKFRFCDGTNWYLMVGTVTPAVCVAVANGGVMAASTAANCDTSWSLVTSSFGSSDIYDVTYMGATGITVGWVAVGAGGKVATSTNGISWTQRTSGTSSALYGVEAYAGTIVAVGVGGVTIRSTNGGTTWSTVTSYTTNDLFDIHTRVGTWYAVGASGTLYESTNAFSTSPTSRTSGFSTTTVRGVTTLVNSADQIKVQLVGDSNKTSYTSYGGTTYTSNNSPGPTGTLYGVSSPNSAYWAVGVNGQLYSDADGVGSWTSQTSSFGTTNIRGMARRELFTVGEAGKMARFSGSWSQVTSPFSGTDVINMISNTNEAACSYGIHGGTRYDGAQDGASCAVHCPAALPYDCGSLPGYCENRSCSGGFMSCAVNAGAC